MRCIRCILPITTMLVPLALGAFVFHLIANGPGAEVAYSGTGGPPLAAADESTPTVEPTSTTASSTVVVDKPDPGEEIAGYEEVCLENAATIINIGIELNMPTRAWTIAVATAMQESSLYNSASPAVSESLNYPHDKVSSPDTDSVGLFQQRTSQGWGTVEQLMTPTYSAKAFYLSLKKVDGWESMSLTDAAAAVQRPYWKYRSYYAKREAAAKQIVTRLTGLTAGI